MSDCVTTIVRLHVHADSPDQAMKAWEVLQRTALGLGLDGLNASVHIDQYEHDHAEDEEDVTP